MKLKLLFAPLALITAVIAFIYLIWPAIKDMEVARVKVKQSETELQKAVTRGENIASLKGSLEQKKDKEDLVSSFLPPQRKEERIIDIIDYLAKDSGVGIININIEKEAQVAPQAPTTVTASESLSMNSNGESIAPDGSVTPNVNKVKFLTTKTSFAGNYENIKMFMDQIYKMEMFHNTNKLSIEHQENQGSQPGGQSANPSALLVDLEVNFGYLTPAALAANAKLSIFEKSAFDWKPLERLESLIARKVPALEEGAKGKSNPFLP